MLDLALLSANAAQLKFVLTNWDHLNFREILLSLVILSIFLQVNFFEYRSMLTFFGKRKSNENETDIIEKICFFFIRFSKQ